MPSRRDAASEVSEGIHQQYAAAAWNIERRLKRFLSKWHGKWEDALMFKPGGVDMMLGDGRYDESLKRLRDRKEITSFNYDFLGLFKYIFLVQTAAQRDHYEPHRDLLWAGILEVETFEEKDPEKESFNYSLFCFTKNREAANSFFTAHRMYQELEGEIQGLTYFFLHETDIQKLTDPNKERRFKPWFIGVRSNNQDDTRDTQQSFSQPYEVSHGILLDAELVLEVDLHLGHLNLQELVRDSDPTRFLKAIIATYEKVLKGRMERFLCPSSNTAELSDVVKQARGNEKFAYYLIWLRALGIVGGAEKNWVDYFYFRVPDLSGSLHSVTIASQTPMDSALFHLIDRKAPSLFPRSLLRLGVKQQELRRQVESYARKSAVVAVMSRNMSHNIGSHVLAGLSSPEQLGITQAGTADSLMGDVATLNSYLQTRMDFLADLATSVPVITLPKRLYGDVSVYLRPSANDEWGQWQKLLMDRISGSTDVRRDKINLTIKIGSEGKSKKVSLNTPTMDPTAVDPVFASPNDMLGAHAFYIILENVIRNCAKHSQIRLKKGQGGQAPGLELTVQVEEAQVKESLDYWRIRIFDNLGKCDADLVRKLNDRITEPILDAEGSLRLGGWGMLEMKIAASYLRKKSPAEIDADHNPPLLTAINQGGNLGFELYLLRPKEALIIEPQGDSFKNLASRAKPFGIDVVGSIKEQLSKADAQHDFLILVSPSDADYAELQKNSEALPRRIFVCRETLTGARNELKKQELLKILRSCTAMSVRAYLWQKWVASNTDNPQLLTIKKAAGTAEVETLLGNENNPQDQSIFFDNHGQRFGQFGTPDKVLYYEPYESKSPTGLILNYLPNDDFIKQTLLYELIEAARLKVLVVDERIQHESTKECTVYPKIKQHTNSQILRWMNISIPDVNDVVNLNKQRFNSSDSQSLETYLGSLATSCDFLLIHLGIIEKLLGRTDEDKISDWLDIWKGKFTNLVVTSGRGRPSNLPRHARFLHYSLVSRYIFQERSKYHLCKVLFASRRLPHER